MAQKQSPLHTTADQKHWAMQRQTTSQLQEPDWRQQRQYRKRNEDFDPQ
jgi:hypothetical protein